MIQYTVEITEKALNDMELIYKHIAFSLLSLENAMGQYNRIANAILKLNTFPARFSIIALEPLYSEELRRMIVDHYSVFYFIQEDRVIVTNVLYNASDIEKRLL